MSIDTEVAKQIAEKIDIETIVARLNADKITAAVEKELIAAIRDYYWADTIAEIMSSDSMEKEIRKAVVAVVKKLQNVYQGVHRG
jgi:uncharacterized membrane-anchored protein YjiN (DUF445 family)